MKLETVNQQSFKGTIVLKSGMYPRKEFEVVPEELKEIVDSFETKTAGKDGTLLVTGLTKDPFASHRDPLQMNTYFKNGSYTDAIAVNDNGVFESNSYITGFENVKNAVDKLVKIFDVYKQRETYVTTELQPLEKQIADLQHSYKSKRQTFLEKMKSDVKQIQIVDEAQHSLNGRKGLELGHEFDYFDIDELAKAQNEKIK